MRDPQQLQRVLADLAALINFLDVAETPRLSSGAATVPDGERDHSPQELCDRVVGFAAYDT